MGHRRLCPLDAKDETMSLWMCNNTVNLVQNECLLKYKTDHLEDFSLLHIKETQNNEAYKTILVISAEICINWIVNPGFIT